MYLQFVLLASTFFMSCKSASNFILKALATMLSWSSGFLPGINSKNYFWPFRIACKSKEEVWIACPPTYCHGILIVMNRHGKMGTSGRVRLGYESNGLQAKTGHFKRIKNGFGSIGLWVRSGRVDPYFSHKFFFLQRKQHVFAIRKVMQQIT